MNIEKVCSKCGEPKSLEEFHHDKRGKHERRSDCKECSSKRGRHYRETNNNKYLESSRKSGKKWYQKNKEIKLAKNKTWLKANYYSREIDKDGNPLGKKREGRVYFSGKEFREARKLQRRRERRTLKGNIDCRMSAGLRGTLKRGEKRGHWEGLVGYSVDDLKRHLEKQFTDKMSWELFMKGEIHIDHIKPKISFFYNSVDSQEFKDCWSLDNLQPLFAIDNLRKGAQKSHEH